jgi:MoxR-like ATPase
MATFIEREEAILALTLAYHSGEHLLMLGPPGTAKTMLAEEFARLTGLKFFHRLLHPFSEPEEILGPIDIQAHKQGRYERIIDGFLPTAEIAFLDEIFKANSAILNALLDAMEYRRLFISPTQTLNLPLKMLIGASNEYPAPDAGLDAFADRFLFMVQVNYVDDGNFKRLLKGTGTPLSIDPLQVPPDTVQVPDEIYDLLLGLRRELRSQGIIVSDRRWVKSIKVMKAHAALRQSDQVERQDVLALRFVLSKPNQVVENLLYSATFPELAEIREAVAELESEFAQAGSNLEALMRVAGRCKTVHASILKAMRSVKLDELDRYRVRVEEINKNIIDLIQLRS